MAKKMREATKQELVTMLSQIEKNDNIAIFNAQKALYVYVDNEKLVNEIIDFLVEKLGKFDE